MVIVNIIDLNQWNLWIAGTHYNTKPKVVKTAKNWCISENADVCYNLALFNLTDKSTVSYVHNKVGDIGYGGKSVVIYLNAENWCGGYSNGILNGVPSVNAPLGGTRTRNGIGKTTDGRIIIAQTNTKMRELTFCKEVNNIVRKQGAEVAAFVLEDGGASTSHYSNLSKLNFAPEGGRAVATVVCLKRRYIPPISRELKRGCKGNDVKLLQQVLGGIEVDGSFGAGYYGTKQRVIAAQKALKIKADGIAGVETLKALGLKVDSSLS